MPDRVPIWARPARGPIAEPFTRLSMALRIVGVPAMALLWWALAFLPWKYAGADSVIASWPPTLPVLFTDLEVVVFGAVGASIVVIGLLGQTLLALLSILLALVVSVVLTLTRGVDLSGSFSSTLERQIMLGVCAVAALTGLAIGAVAIGSLRRFGFLGMLAVSPVVSLVAVVFLDPRADHRWLTRAVLVVLLVMIGWRAWSGILLWPIFFVLFWVLSLTMTALGYGAQTLRRGSNASVSSVTDAMPALVRSAWRVLLGTSWDLFWPAAVIAAVVVAARYLWQRTGTVSPGAQQTARLR